MELVIESFKHTLTVTTFVFVMMVWVDYANVSTRGALARSFAGNAGRQYVASSFLGAIPGCLGAFMNVSLFIHGLISFGAVVAGMVATSGDEAFVMFAMFPRQALLLTVVLFVVGVAPGWLVDRVGARFPIVQRSRCSTPQVHEHDDCRCFRWPELLDDLRRPTLARAALALLLAFVLYSFVSGAIGPPAWDWTRVTFVILIASTLLIVVTVPEHYLHEHIWNHIAKRHLWRIAVWTFGALALVNVAMAHWPLETYVRDHMAWVFFAACVAGLIPESGPHLIFVVLFAGGLIPFSVLLASSIVQDGHGMLPLLSHSVGDAVAVKAINLVIGVVVGGIVYLLGW
jgi:hypothetical protein